MAGLSVLRVADGHGGDLASAARAFGLPAGSFLDFSASLNPYGPPPGLPEGLAACLDAVGRYPDPAAREARQHLAPWLGVAPEHLVLTNGGAEAIYLAARFWAGGTPGQPSPPRRAIIPMPAFSEYARAAAAAGLAVVAVPPGHGLAPDAARLGGLLRPGDMLFFTSPHNPTGALADPAALLALAGRAAGVGALVVLDEAFLPLVPGFRGLTLAPRAAAAPGLLVLGSLTKVFSLPGLRLGYIVARAGATAGILAQQPAWSVGALAQAAVPLCLRDPAFQESAAALIAAERARLAAALAALTLPTGRPAFHPLPSQANFLLVDGRATGRTAAGWRTTLGRRGLLIRDCANLPGLDPFYFRVAVRTPAEDDVLLAALASILAAGV